MTPTIAVVIPAWNSAQTIRTALESVLCQSRPADEVIVVDDGSADHTARVVRRFGDAVRLIQQGNGGSAVARQTGSLAAAAEYIAYLDADDWWPSDKLEVTLGVLRSEQVDFMLADLQRAEPGAPPEAYQPRNTAFFPAARAFFERFPSPSGTADLYRLPAPDALDLLLTGFPVYPSTAIVRRQALLDVGGWDARFRRCQDFDIGLRLVRHFPMHFHDRVQAVLGLHEVNRDATAYVLKQTRGDIAVLEAHYRAEPPASAYRQQVARALARKWCALGYQYRVLGDRAEARAAYRAAMRWPSKRLHAALRWLAPAKPSRYGR